MRMHASKRAVSVRSSTHAFALDTIPSHFQQSLTVVLRKASDRDYQVAKSNLRLENLDRVESGMPFALATKAITVAPGQARYQSVALGVNLKFELIC